MTVSFSGKGERLQERLKTICPCINGAAGRWTIIPLFFDIIGLMSNYWRLCVGYGAFYVVLLTHPNVFPLHV
jgi:hypothetical protein